MMTPKSYSFGPFEFDRQQGVLLKHGEVIAVGQKCLILLETLLAAEGRAVSKGDLIEAAWKGGNIEESNLAVQIAALRKAIGTNKLGEEWITTVQRVGYQFKALNSSAGTQEAAVKPSVAVLPFLNLSGDGRQDYFSDGVTSDIITELSRWQMLSVLSGAATFRYRNVATDLRQIAQELKARYVVEGSVRRMGKHSRITVQLVDTETGNQVWAEKFDHQASEIFEVQDQVVRTIVSTLVGRVIVADAARAKRKAPNSLAAYECVLKGNALFWDDDAAANEATNLFAKAVEIDPSYGLAHAFLAFMHIRLWIKDPGNSNHLIIQAHQLAQRAVDLDGNESTCFSVLSLSCLYLRNFEPAQQFMQRSIELNPNNQWNAADMGIVQTYLGHQDLALHYFRRAKEIDSYFAPRWYFSYLGRAHMLRGSYKEALATFANSPEQSYYISAVSAACHARLSNSAEAANFVGKCLQLRPTFSVAQFMSKEPFKKPEDAAHMRESLHLAGLPD